MLYLANKDGSVLLVEKTETGYINLLGEPVEVKETEQQRLFETLVEVQMFVSGTEYDMRMLAFMAGVRESKGFTPNALEFSSEADRTFSSGTVEAAWIGYSNGAEYQKGLLESEDSVRKMKGFVAGEYLSSFPGQAWEVFDRIMEDPEVMTTDSEIVVFEAWQDFPDNRIADAMQSTFENLQTLWKGQ